MYVYLTEECAQRKHDNNDKNKEEGNRYRPRVLQGSSPGVGDKVVRACWRGVVLLPCCYMCAAYELEFHRPIHTQD